MDLQDKLTILGLINENKEILFGKFSDKLTHEVKINKWKEITKNVNNSGITDKDWKYLRDTTWQLIIKNYYNLIILELMTSINTVV